jgi:acetoacetyl-CoA synthetase
VRARLRTPAPDPDQEQNVNRPLWTPSPERIRQAAITGFRRAAAAETGLDLPDYDALHAWSVADPSSFWRFYADYARLPFRTLPERILSDDPMPHTRWFEGATLNYAEALLFPPELGAVQRPAIVALSEAGDERSLDYAELRSLVARIQSALMREGVTRGDRVAAFSANLPETVALLLACAGLGAVFTSCSPDFGLDAAGARFGQVEPVLLFASPVYRYGGRRFDVSATVTALAAELPSARRTVLLPYPGEETPVGVGTPWDAWLGDSEELALEGLPFDHPLYVLYSSGTTGLPKAIVHRAGGALLAHHREHRLHSDIRPGDAVFYFATCGWMMWNWLVSALAQAATIVLYEGSPAFPDNLVLWRAAERHGITFFGTSARYLHSLQGRDVHPGEVADLAALRTIGSTGSPLAPSAFEYVYRHIKADVHLASLSGGTDIVSCSMLGVPTLPVYAGQIQRPGLGVDLAVFDDAGDEVEGGAGELVCRSPLPSMPLSFWNDPDKERYRDAYFAHFPGVWRHGDRIERTDEGGIVVYGRSDATLNPGGVRIGTAEIYRPLEALAEVVEAAAVGKKIAGDEEVWLFVVLREGELLAADLVARIRQVIRAGASPRHAPRRVIQVPDLPRTRSGKAMEIAIAQLVNGMKVPNREVMANPEALDEIERAIVG